MKMNKKLYQRIEYKNNKIYFIYKNREYQIFDSTIKTFSEMHNITNNIIKAFKL